MKREGIAYGPVIGYTALLIAASGALGWVVTGSWYPLAILLVPVIGIAAYRLIGLYSDSIRRVTFMFNAIDNDDFTFRFHEDPSKVDNGMLNAALNRIKEILVRAKVRAEERERYYQLIMEYARTGLRLTIGLSRDYKFKMVFSDLRVFYQTVYPKDEGSPLILDIDETKTLRLKYNQNIFSLQVSDINYDYPSLILYSWKLEGFYEGWSRPGEENVIRFTNLSPGNYTLRVRAISNEDRRETAL